LLELLDIGTQVPKNAFGGSIMEQCEQKMLDGKQIMPAIARFLGGETAGDFNVGIDLHGAIPRFPRFHR
jgi:hypothetical protein